MPVGLFHTLIKREGVEWMILWERTKEYKEGKIERADAGVDLKLYTFYFLRVVRGLLTLGAEPDAKVWMDFHRIYLGYLPWFSISMRVFIYL